jgi:hypothetical protein
LRAPRQRVGDGIVKEGAHARRAAELSYPRPHRAGADDAENHMPHRPWNSGLRFSRNAFMPSTRSSVAIASSYRRRS